jgi:signal transduction histidine kinase
VLVEVGREGKRLRFAVYDQGPGVSAPRQERIFEPFQHADRREEARPPGSGLGLPVARRIAEAHGGGITLESPPHAQPDGPAHHFSGAKFVIEIPAVPVTATLEARPSTGSV